MSKSNAFETSVNDLIYTGAAIADIAENDTTTPATTLTISLHTTPGPGEAGTMLTNEATFGSYARQTLTRSGVEFTVAGATVAFANDLDFPEATSGTETITHFGVGSGVTNDLMYFGTLTPNPVVVSGVIVRINAGTFLTED